MVRTISADYNISSDSFSACKQHFWSFRVNVRHFGIQANLSPKPRRFVQQNAMKVHPMDDSANKGQTQSAAVN
jgi:hypothetical protein